MGLSSEESAKIISSNQMILHSSMVNQIIPSLLGSNEEVARLLKRCAWFLLSDLKKILMPNVEILKSCSIPMERILYFLHDSPRSFLVKPDIMRKSIDRAIKFGIPHTSVVFIRALSVFLFTSERMWEVKLETLRDLGFSGDDIFAMFRKQPLVFLTSVKMMKSKIELILAIGKYNINSIVTCPVALGSSHEKRLEPRMQILRLLERRNLIEKWPVLSKISKLTDDKFFGTFIRPRLAKNTS